MNGALLAGGIVVAYLVFKGGGLGNLFGSARTAGNTSAHGQAPPYNGGVPTEAAVGGAIGAGACVAGGAALGAPQAGAALAGLCGALGAKLAPLAVSGAKKVGEGAVYVGKEIGAGGAFLGRKVAEGASAAYHEVGDTARNPSKLIELSVAPVAVADRVVTKGYDALPATAKLALAPVVIPTKVAAKIVAGGATVATSVAHGTETVAKGVLSGTSAVLSKINPFSSGINCSVAQQPGNAADCRRRYGMTSAPGSDAWARQHGQTPILTGPGST